MLGGILKQGWQSKSAEKRRLAVVKMDEAKPKNQTILEGLANNDPSAAVREHAIQKLRNPSVLFTISQTHSDTDTCEQALASLRKVIGPKSELTLEQFNDLVAQHADAAVLVAEHCPFTDLRHSITNQLSEKQKASIVGNIEYTESRQFIAEQLGSVESLEEARKNLKGKDKRAEKTVRDALDLIRSKEKAELANQQAALEICTNMEFIAQHPQWRAEFKQRYQSYNQRWTALALMPSVDLQQRFDTACTLAMTQVERQIETESAQQEQNKAAKDLANRCLWAIDKDLERLIEANEESKQVLHNSSALWLESSQTARAEPALSSQFVENQKALSSLTTLADASITADSIGMLNKALKSFEWPRKLASPVAIAEAEERLQQQRQLSSDQAKNYKDQLDSLHKRINRLIGLTKKGSVRTAQHEVAAITKAAEQYTGRDKKSLDERLEQAQISVGKMADWQNFATEPKFIELCEAMEELAKSTLHPDAKAKKISTLQQKWKSLGHPEVSDAHWDRFKVAGDLAYEPCAEFFEQRKTTRKANLENREPLIARMHSVLENTPWDDEPNYKEVEQSLRDIANAWREIKDVERNAGEKQWQRLCKVRDQVNAKLDLVYDANIELKQQLCKQTEAMLSMDLNDDAVGKLQLFQSRWKQIGITRRKQDQAAWKQFKAASDAVYQKVQDQRKAKRADDDAQLDGYRSIIKQVYQLAKTTTSLADSDPVFEQLSADYQALPALPKGLPEKLIDAIQADFNKAGVAYSNGRDRVLKQNHQQQIELLEQKAKLCAELEAIASQKDDSAISALQQKIDDIEMSDKPLADRFAVRLESALQDDRQQAFKDRRLLCIDLEILLGVQSPEQDRALRTQIQLERMKEQGIGHNNVSKDKAIEEFKLNWLCMPGAEAEFQAEMDGRFDKLLTST